MPEGILVTGASGYVGREVVRALAERGERVVAARRRVARENGALGRPVALDFEDRTTWSRALDGCDRMFLMRPPAIADVERTLCPFVDQAFDRGVRHVVLLSVAGAERSRWIPHRRVEDHLRAAGDGHTILRPGFFAQNLASAYRPDIVEDDRIYVPAGRAPVSWVDVRDVAEVAAMALADPTAHRGAAYTLAGPEPVPWTAVAATLSEVTGRPIRYQPASIPGYAAHLARRGLPAGAIAVQTALHVLLRFGQGVIDDPTLERLLGHPPRTIHRYIADHPALWSRPK